MVKKIRLIDDDDTAIEDVDTQEYQETVINYLQAIDWKLWEMLKIEQARAEAEGLELSQPDSKRKKRKSDVKSIIVDED